MAKKTQTSFVCQTCGWSSPKWSGQCGECGAWNSLVESVVQKVGASGGSGSSGGAPTVTADPQFTLSLDHIGVEQTAVGRISTGMYEFDRVLGSSLGEDADEMAKARRVRYGMVPGAVMLMGGEPGIGKSTLLTQLAVEVIRQHPEASIAYMTGEESPGQIALRIKRLLQAVEQSTDKKGIDKKSATKKNAPVDLALVDNQVADNPSSGPFDPTRLHFITSHDVDQVIAQLYSLRPTVAIIDSLQTLTASDLTGAAGSFGQMRETADRLTQAVKAIHLPTFLIGHVTKDGAIAGPKIVEHIVDTVLELTGERTGELRLLRTLKNRFGPTDEVGIFRMEESGLTEVSNPAELFLEHQEPTPGSAVACVLEGTRPFLVEVQALVVPSQLAMPRRVGRGVQLSRIQVLAAVLEKYCRLPLSQHDIFVNVAGGFVINEPSVDLGLALALASSFQNKSLPRGVACVGEVGLLGEIRKVSFFERREKEMKRLGYSRAVSRSSHATVQQCLREMQLL